MPRATSAARRPAKRAASTLSIDARGIAEAARQIRSPNRDARPRGTKVTLVVLHGISLPPGEFGGDGIIELFTNRLDPLAHDSYRSLEGLRVSAHFLIRRDGELVQFVPCSKRAWHAGVSTWRGRGRCNDFSIGVELEGTDDLSYTRAQYRVLKPLLDAIRRRYPIGDVVGHSDVAPGRKTDPGPTFDWSRISQVPARVAAKGRARRSLG
jgi:AmpD protein